MTMSELRNNVGDLKYKVDIIDLMAKIYILGAPIYHIGGLMYPMSVHGLMHIQNIFYSDVDSQEEEASYEDDEFIEMVLTYDAEIKGDKIIFTKPKGENNDPV